MAAQLVRPEPDSHRVARAELGRPAHAGQTPDRVQHLRRDQIVQGITVDSRVGRLQGDDHQEVVVGLGNNDAVSHYLIGQTGRGNAQTVLHLHGGDVRIGTV